MNNTLLIGTGGCGNKLLNTAIDIIKGNFGLKNNYDYRFVNSNDGEMNILSNYDSRTNALPINGDGTGRNPIKAKEALSADRTKLINHFATYISKYTSAVIMSSGDGGFGNGSVSILSNVIKNLNPDIKINLLIAMPTISARKASLENAKSIYKDILSLRKSRVDKDGNSLPPIVNSVLFIDNSNMKDEDEFNNKSMKLFIDSLELGYGAFDTNDAFLVNGAERYKAIIPLDTTYRTLEDAINAAAKTSPFVFAPNVYNCTHLGGVIDKKYFNKDEILEKFEAKVFEKIEYGDGSQNLLVVGGCVMPDDHMRMLDEALNMINEANLEEESQFKFESVTNKKEQKSKKQENTSKANTAKALREMMDDDFWNM
ncbi:MAG: hypothetical protein ACLTDM_19510 [Clostridium butyricum]